MADISSKKVTKNIKFKSMKEIIAKDAFNGGGHLVYKRYGVPRFRLADLKSFRQQFKKNNEELFGLLSSKDDEKLRKILINQKDGNIELDDCITFISLSLGIIDEPNLPLEEEAEEFLFRQPQLLQEEAVTEDGDPTFTTEHLGLADTTESNLMALIENLEEKVACITRLITLLEMEGSAKVEMDRVLRRLFDLLGNYKKKHSVSLL